MCTLHTKRANVKSPSFYEDKTVRLKIDGQHSETHNTTQPNTSSQLLSSKANFAHQTLKRPKGRAKERTKADSKYNNVPRRTMRHNAAPRELSADSCLCLAQ